MTEQDNEQKQNPAPIGFWDIYADGWNPMIVLEFRSFARNPAVGCWLIVAMLVQFASIVVLLTGIHGYSDFVYVACIAYLYVVGMLAVFAGFREGRVTFSIRRTYLYDWLGGDAVFRRGYGDPDEILEQNPLPNLQKFHARFLIGLIWSVALSLCVLPLAVVFDIVSNNPGPVATLMILGGIYGVQTLRLLFHSLFPINRTVGEYIVLLIVAVIIAAFVIASFNFAINMGHRNFGFGLYFLVMSVATPIVAYPLIRHHLAMSRKRARKIALMNGVAYIGVVAVATLGGVFFMFQ